MNLKEMHPGAREQLGAAGSAWERFSGLTVNDGQRDLFLTEDPLFPVGPRSVNFRSAAV
jgi:hypothetical protein